MPLDYDCVTYPDSVLRFRGPRQDLSRPYTLCLGGAETFGRFIHAPFPSQLAERLPEKVINMGVASAGLDVLMSDPVIRAATQSAHQIVLQVPGAPNMTNRFYKVHPRRNDRFLKASAMLRTIYRDVDFTEMHFTRHLMTRLKDLSADRFSIVRHEIQTAWCARMLKFIDEAPAPVHLLWIANRHPDDPEPAEGIGRDPLFVTREMLDRVAAVAASLTIAAGVGARDETSTQGMFFASREEAAARQLPGPQAHDRAASALLDQLAP